MGTVNYFTSDYITMGVKPYDAYDFENDQDFMREVQEQIKEYGGTLESWIDDYIKTCYEDDEMNVSAILEKNSFYYYHVTIKPGYYEGFTLNVESNFPVAFDGWEDKRAAQREITSLKSACLNVPGSAWFNVRRVGVPGTMIIKALARP
jgi:hypothetical protein